MRKSNKEVLYRAAFKLFMIRLFDGVSISDIENESGLTRGAVFYYANTKQELFKQVVEYFIVGKQDIESNVKFDINDSLDRYIDEYISGITRTMDYLVGLLQPISLDEASRAYMSTLLQVCTLFPDVKQKYLANVNNDVARWTTIINASISRNEVKGDIDVLSVARQFASAFYGMSFMDSMSHGLNVGQLREQMYTIYNLIKKS